jgi:hypothetical protein
VGCTGNGLLALGCHTPPYTQKIIVISKRKKIFVKTKNDKVCTRKKIFGKEIIHVVLRKKKV